MSTRAEFLSSLGATVAAAAPLPSYTATTTFGVVCPLSGDAKRAGEQMLDGVRAAIDDWNQRRSPLDRAFAYRTYDDHNTPADAIVESGFVTGESDIVAVIGHLSSRATLAGMPTYQNTQTPLIVPATTDERVTEDARFSTVFRLPAGDVEEGAALARAVVRERKPAKPIILVQDGDYGADVATGVLNGMKSLGVAATYIQYGWQNPKTADVARQVLAAGADHVTLAGTATDMGTTLVALRAAGYAGRLAASQGFFAPETVTRFAAAAEGMLISSSMPYLPLAPQSTRITQDFASRYGYAFSLLPAFGYAAAQIAIAAVRRASIPNRAGVLRALQSPQSFDTVVGPLTFASGGAVVDPNVYLYTIANGKFAYVRQAKPGGYLLK